MKLKLTDVNAYYGLHHILHDVSFELGAGEILALLGRNGAGKTTTLRTIMGLVDRCEGSIAYNGASLVGLKTHAINRLGLSYVTEYRGVFSDLTVAEKLNIAALKTSDWAVEDILELFPKLREQMDRRGRHIYGGETQRLASGRGLL